MDRANSRAEGVTLLELLAVLAIVGVIASIAYSRLRDDLYDLESASRQFGDHLREARALALRTGVPHRVRLEADGRRYQLLRMEEAAGGGRRPVVVRDYELRDPLAFAAGRVPLAVDFAARGELAAPRDELPLVVALADRRSGRARQVLIWLSGQVIEESDV